jgi:hypothetical protein
MGGAAPPKETVSFEELLMSNVYTGKLVSGVGFIE